MIRRSFGCRMGDDCHDIAPPGNRGSLRPMDPGRRPAAETFVLLRENRLPIIMRDCSFCRRTLYGHDGRKGSAFRRCRRASFCRLYLQEAASYAIIRFSYAAVLELADRYV